MWPWLQDAESGKERYVFFSFPHIAVSPFHKPGVLTRSGRPGDSAACGALVKALGDFKADGLEASSKTPGGEQQPLKDINVKCGYESVNSSGLSASHSIDD